MSLTPEEVAKSTHSFTGQYLAKEPQDCRFIFDHQNSLYSSIGVFDFIIPVLISCHYRVVTHTYQYLIENTLRSTSETVVMPSFTLSIPSCASDTMPPFNAWARI